MKDAVINAVSIGVLILVLLLMVIFSGQFHRGVFLQILGACFGIVGLIIWIAGKITLGEQFTTSLTPKGLVTKGIYSRIRHPMYSGGILIYLGIGLLFKSIVGLILTMILIAPLLIYSALREEKLLIEKYGWRYVEYKKKTVFW